MLSDFAAAFLQPPNYDKDRPASMNFGAVSRSINLLDLLITQSYRLDR